MNIDICSEQSTESQAKSGDNTPNTNQWSNMGPHDSRGMQQGAQTIIVQFGKCDKWF